MTPKPAAEAGNGDAADDSDSDGEGGVEESNFLVVNRTSYPACCETGLVVTETAFGGC